ncbi:uncharacterized mitochondrial protein AtMg00810-like [Prosopis cineraria]|uniref:uncharacterized mitochondrial protein AtMg00810-like n=1 Tax=Prosopis cineraria TaxID=364024 RepID=UPI0024104F3D|nr:uncharacterized mitochondrial protein AtMg00810-like [Prosopis cineraria]
MGMLGYRPVETSIEVKKPKKKLKVNEEGEEEKEEVKEKEEAADKERYQKLVRKLIYLSYTRPNIAFIVSVASQYMTFPMKSHMEAVYKILRYLKGTPGRVTWRSQKQRVVSRSSAEFELRALA